MAGGEPGNARPRMPRKRSVERFDYDFEASLRSGPTSAPQPKAGKKKKKKDKKEEADPDVEYALLNEPLKDKTLLFDWEEEDAQVPYHLQGDEGLYTQENMRKRKALRHHPAVEAALQMWWNVYKKNDNGSVEKQEYAKVHKLICRVLIPSVPLDEVHESGEHDWENDANGGDELDYEQLANSLFEMADLWCRRIDAEEYAQFLKKMLRRLTTTTIKSGKTGTVVTKNPRTKLRALFKISGLFSDVIDAKKDKLNTPDVRATKPGEQVSDEDKEDLKTHGVVLDHTQNKTLEDEFEDADNEVNITWCEYEDALPFDPEEDEDEEEEFNTDEVAYPLTARTQQQNEMEDIVQNEEHYVAMYREADEVVPTGTVAEYPKVEPPEFDDLVTPQAEFVPTFEDTSGGDGSKTPSSRGTPVSRSGVLSPDMVKEKVIAEAEERRRSATPSGGRSATPQSPEPRIMSPPPQHEQSRTVSPVPEDVEKVPASPINKPSSKRRAHSIELVDLSDTPGVRGVSASERGPSSRLQKRESVKVLNSMVLPKKEERHKLNVTVDQDDTIVVEPKNKSVTATMNTLGTHSLRRLIHHVRNLKAGADVSSQELHVEVPKDIYQRDNDEENPEEDPVDPNAYYRDNYTKEDTEFDEHNRSARRIVVIGPPSSGKTTVAKKLAAELNLKYISGEEMLGAILEDEKSKAIEEKDEETEEVISVTYGPLTTAIHEGKTLTDLDVASAMHDVLSEDHVKFTGFVLDDLPISGVNMAKSVALLQEMSAVPTHLVELGMTEDEYMSRKEGLRMDHETGVVYSKYQYDPPLVPAPPREEKKKEIKLDEEGNPIPEDEPPAPVDPEEVAFLPRKIDVEPSAMERFVRRMEDFDGNAKAAWKEFVASRSTLDNSETLRSAQIIVADAIQSPDDVYRYILFCLGVQHKPIGDTFRPTLEAVPLEVPEGTAPEEVEKALLTQGLEDLNEVRGWSEWEKFSPVALKNSSKLVVGNPRFAAAYMNKVYLMEDQEALDKFVANPKYYLGDRPQLPIPAPRPLMIIGPPLSGKTTIAKMAQEDYQLPAVDFEDKFLEKAEEEKKELGPVAINMKARGSTAQFATLSKDVQEILTTEATPLDPPAEETPQEDPDTSMQDGVDISEEGAEPDAEAAANAAPAEEEQQPDVRDAYRYTIDGFPRAEEQIDLMTSVVIPKVVIMFEDSSNGEELMKRADSLLLNPKTGHYDFYEITEEKEAAVVKIQSLMRGYRVRAGKKPAGPKEGEEVTEPVEKDPEDPRSLLYPIKPALETHEANMPKIEAKLQAMEDVDITKISCNKTVEEMYARVKMVIDPFIPRAHEVNWADLLPQQQVLGNTRNYCPVSLHQNGLLVPGKKDIAARFKDQVYLFFSEEERQEFLLHPLVYVPEAEPKAPPPRILVLGPVGVGKTSLVRSLAEEHSLPCVEVRKHLEAAKKKLETQAAQQKSELEETEGAEVEVINPEDEALQVVAALEDLVTQDNVMKSGCLIDATGSWNANVANAVLNRKDLHVDVAMYLKMSEEYAIQRNFKAPPLPPPVTLPPPPEPAEGEEPPEPPTEEEIAAQKAELEEARQAKITEMVEEAKNKVKDTFNAGIALLPDLEAAIKARDVPILQLNTDKRTLEAVFVIACEMLKPWLEYRPSIFAQPQKITVETADALLRGGWRHYCKFDIFDPVHLKDGMELRRPDDIKDAAACFPVQYRHYVIFFTSEETREKFMMNPVEYFDQPPRPPVIVPNVCVVGPPKSGKTTLAKNLSRILGVVRLSHGEILRRVCSAPSKVGMEVYEQLRTGTPVGPELTLRALKYVISSLECREKGWVLDGLPRTRSELEFLEANNIFPHLVFNMQLSEYDVFERKPTPFPFDPDGLCLDSVDIRNDDYDVYEVENQHILEHYNHEDDNVINLDGSKSIWWLYDSVAKSIRANIRDRQRYQTNIEAGRAAAVACMNVRPDDFDRKVGKFRRYCPVTLVKNKQLVETDSGLKYCAEYKGRYYVMAGQKELDMFLAHPTSFLSKYRLPIVLPSRVVVDDNLDLINLEFALKGYCPVTYNGQLDWKYLQPGNPDMIAEYDGQYYCFVDSAAREKFMRQPWKYSELKLPNKLPPPRKKLDVNKLPVIGYLEQSLNTVLAAAMNELWRQLPKYPHLSVASSACKFLSIYMKAHNPHILQHRRDKYEKKLDAFLEDCGLIPYLSNLDNSRADPAKYEEKGQLMDKLRNAELMHFIR